jgi:hypothetical protein
MRSFKFLFLTTAMSAVVASTGCSKAPEKSGTATAPTAAAKPSPEGEKLILPADVTESQTVIAARESVKDGDEVAVVGRIGGSVDPWIKGRAAFTIVDPTLMSCSDNPGDGCPTPWDYCCDTDRLPKATAMVKFVDAEGKSVETDARELLGVKELQTVVVKGKAQRDEAGNLTVLASGLFVRPTNTAAVTKPHDHDHDHDHKDSK